ncbi:hypothetical protein [Candidatus Venteria ishoeyi]|uniref:Lipoprotein n=1 Tax=Candidatus Venteria ishoeyi TaxID=1899563 RepID=A0A1H6FEQ1_9GAMM|nr:hypothetical protein [Candidatus Venteria ishoeyi]SEH07891.1 Uncharacterised protein [Candidatus Venteria ishoeyi]
MKIKTLFLLISSLFMTACGSQLLKPDDPNSTKTPVVWSTDDTALAVVIPVNNPENPNSEQYQIVTQRPDGSDRQQITEVFPQTVMQLHYIKEQGYLIAGFQLQNGGLRIDRITPNGNAISIIETKTPAMQLCQGQKDSYAQTPLILPSPDGLWLVNLYSQTCNSLTIDFLQAGNLQTVSSYELELEQQMFFTWHPMGYLLIAGSDQTTVWQVDKDHPPLKTTAKYPRCFYPSTRSSAIAADGRHAWFEAGQVKIETGDAKKAFGCQ